MTTEIIGLTGGYCAGKNAAASVLGSLGFHVIDVDRVGHTTLEEKQEEVAQLFGPVVREEKGGIDRKKLGHIVFSDKKKLGALEKILHPAMKEAVSKETKDFVDRDFPVCINAALLFTMELHRLCTHVLMVKAPLHVRFRRARARDGLGFMSFLRRIWSQHALFPKKSGNKVDMYTVWNSSDRGTLQRRIEEYIKLIERQA